MLSFYRSPWAGGFARWFPHSADCFPPSGCYIPVFTSLSTWRLLNSPFVGSSCSHSCRRLKCLIIPHSAFSIEARKHYLHQMRCPFLFFLQPIVIWHSVFCQQVIQETLWTEPSFGNFHCISYNEKPLFFSVKVLSVSSCKRHNSCRCVYKLESYGCVCTRFNSI